MQKVYSRNNPKSLFNWTKIACEQNISNTIDTAIEYKFRTIIITPHHSGIPFLSFSDDKKFIIINSCLLYLSVCVFYLPHPLLSLLFAATISSPSLFRFVEVNKVKFYSRVISINMQLVKNAWIICYARLHTPHKQLLHKLYNHPINCLPLYFETKQCVSNLLSLGFNNVERVEFAVVGRACSVCAC